MRTRHPLLTPAFLAAVLILGGSAAAFWASVDALRLTLRKKPIYPRSGLKVWDVPAETRSWVRVYEGPRVDAETEKTLGTGNYVSRVYQQKGVESAVQVELHLAYYTGMIDTVPHVPDRCFVGGGMAIGGFEGDLAIPLEGRWSEDSDTPEALRPVMETRLDNDYSRRPGTYVRLPRDPAGMKLRTWRFVQKDRTVYSGYFFIANGGHVSRAEDVRLLAFDLKSEYAYYLKVQVTGVQNVRSGDDLARATGSLLDELLGEIMLAVPDWVEVQTGKWPEKVGS